MNKLEKLIKERLTYSDLFYIEYLLIHGYFKNNKWGIVIIYAHGENRVWPITINPIYETEITSELHIIYING